MGIDWVKAGSGKQVLRISERLSFDSHKDFRAAIRQWECDPRKASIDVDLGRVSYIDSSGLGLLLLLKDTVRAAGHQISFVNGDSAACPTLRMLAQEPFALRRSGKSLNH